KDLQTEINELEENIEDRFDLLKNRVSSYQESGGSTNYLEVIFGAENFGDFINRLSSVTKIMDSDVTLMEALEEDVQKIEENEKLSLEKLDELNAMKEDQEEKVGQIANEKADTEKAQQSLEKKREELAALTEDLKLEDSELAKEETDALEQIELAQKEAADKKEQEKKQEPVKEEKQETQEEPKPEKEEKQKDDDSEHENKNNNKNNSNQDESKDQSEEEKKDTEKDKTNKKEQKSVQVASSTTSSSSQGEKKQETKKEDNQNSFEVTATAYTVESAGGSGVTATGINLKENPNEKVITVDPSVISLGSVVEVGGYGYALAGDTGGAIKGKKIVVHVPTAQHARNWGVQTVNVTIH